MVKFQYPKVIITEKRIKFLNEKGRMENNIILNRKNMEWPLYNNKWERIVPLDSDKIVIGGNKGEYPFGEDSYLYIKWIDKKGKTIKIEKGCLTTILSENGKYIVDGDLYEGYDCILYDINGNRLWIYNAEENLKGMHILHDEKVVIIEGIEEKKDKAKISLIETNGKKLWEKEIVRASGYDHNIFSTRENKIIVYGGGGIYDNKTKNYIEEYVLYGFDEKGNLLWEPKEYIGFDNNFRGLKLSEKFLCGVRVGGYLWMMDINNGNIVWEHNLGKFNLKDYEILYQISLDDKYILLGESILLDTRNGKILKRIERIKGARLLDKNNIWSKKDNKIEIFSISDLLKED